MKVGLLLEDTGLHRGFADDLKSEGIGVETLVIPASLSRSQALAVGSAFLKDARGCDLVHNLSGCLGLLFAQMLYAPVVSSVTGALTEEEALMCRALSGRCFFVSEDGGGLAGLREVPGLPPFQGNRVAFYLDAYSRVLALGKPKEHRPWGSYEVLSEDRDDHKVKRITVLPGKRLSLQYHGRRSEHWVVISGRALATVGEAVIELGPSQAADIPLKAVHRIENIGSGDLVFIEVQQGDYFGEDDIVRLEDDFGRV